MDRTKRRVRKLVVVGAALAVAGSVVPAAYSQTAPQQVDAQIASVLSLATSPTSAVNFGALSLTNPNTASGGSVGVTYNVPYSVKLTTNHANMTKWTGAAYDTNYALASPLAVSASAAAGSGATAVGAATTTAAAKLAEATGGTLVASNPLGVGITGGTDSYDLSLSQPATIADQAGNYRVELTYTLSQGV